MSSGAVTAQEIARRAGVAQSTVSRVLNDRAGRVPISTATRERVLRIAEELDYQPNAAARAFRSGRAEAIALVIAPTGRRLDAHGGADDQFHLFRSYGLGEFTSGLEAAARERGYSVLLRVADPAFNAAGGALNVLRRRQADAVITWMLPLSDTDTGGIVVAVNPRDREPGDSLPPGATCLWTDDVDGAQQATRHLIDAGHRRIAHIRGQPDNPLTTRREQGYRAALEQAGIEPNVLSGDFSVESGRQAATQLLSLPSRQRPTAVFAANDRMAVGLLNALTEAGLRVPDDMALAGFDNTELSALVRPALTTVDLPMYVVGRRAAESAMAAAGNAAAAPSRRESRHSVVPVKLIVRRSSAR